MAVLLKFRVVNQTLASYDRIAGNISEAERIRKVPAFIAQALYETPDGVTAIEIWESSELSRAWDSGFRRVVDQGLAAEHLEIEEEMIDIYNLVLPFRVQWSHFQHHLPRVARCMGTAGVVAGGCAELIEESSGAEVLVECSTSAEALVPGLRGLGGGEWSLALPLVPQAWSCDEPRSMPTRYGRPRARPVETAL